MAPPNFSAFPWDRLPRVSKAEVRAQSIAARWLSAAPATHRLEQLVGGPIRAAIVAPDGHPDPHAARCAVKLHGAVIEARGSSLAVRAITQKVVGGAEELAAPRPLNVVENGVWSLVVATALADLEIDAKVWPISASVAGTRLVVDARFGDVPIEVELVVPPEIELRAAPSRPPAWTQRMMFDVPVVIGRSAIAISDLPRLAPRTIVTFEPVTGMRISRIGKAAIQAAELEVFGGTLGLRGKPGDVVAEVVTGYVPRPMSLPDDAHVELTVGLGTTRMSLRQIVELAVGQVVTLGRPLAGPFELRAAGKLVGKGELVDVDGELAVRIVSLGDQE